MLSYAIDNLLSWLIFKTSLNRIVTKINLN